MSDCMIIRRGGGGQGFDPNGAVLKVITSTGCTVLVTGTGYSKTHQQADGFPRSGDANVTEHFFSIPASAFGTITVKATNTYGDNTKMLTVNTAGEVYEALLSAPNILLNSEFGKQDGLSITATSTASAIYDSDYKTYTLQAPANISCSFSFTKAYDVSLYSAIRITYRLDLTGYYITAKNKDDVQVLSVDLASSINYVTKTVELTDKDKTPFTFGFYKSNRSGSASHKLIISEIVLS